MNQSRKGRRVGARLPAGWWILVKVHANRPVYVLASHSHFYVKGIFNTPEWRKRAAVLPGWIVRTAGAVRDALPAQAAEAQEAKTGVYGYLLATVDVTRAEPITFEFRELAEGDVPVDV